MKKISKQAREALLAASPRGAVPRTPAATELFMADLVTARGNLTMRGSIERDRLAREAEDEAFG